jgi:hypothetical protein
MLLVVPFTVLTFRGRDRNRGGRCGLLRVTRVVAVAGRARMHVVAVTFPPTGTSGGNGRGGRRRR